MATGGDDKKLPEGGKHFGLKCFGKDSWCNSIVQALYFHEPLRASLLEYYNEKRKKEGADGERTLLSPLADLFALISSQDNQTGVVDTQSFMDVVRDEYRIAGDYTQLDVHEFLLKLLTEVAKTVERGSAAIGLKGFQDAHEFLLKLLTEEAKTVEKDSAAIGLKGFQVMEAASLAEYRGRAVHGDSTMSGAGQSSSGAGSSDDFLFDFELEDNYDEQDGYPFRYMEQSSDMQLSDEKASPGAAKHEKKKWGTEESSSNKKQRKYDKELEDTIKEELLESRFWCYE